MNMKKTLAVVLPIMAAAALASCRTGSQVTTSVKSLSKGVTGMTAEKAAGIYQMTAITLGTAKNDNMLSAEDYTCNVLTLGSDGTYSLSVVTRPTYEKQEAEEKEYAVSGTFEIADNGMMQFFASEPGEDGKPARAYIAASDEQVFYDDENGKILFDGSVIDMEYTRENVLKEEERAVKEPEASENAEDEAKKPVEANE